MSLIPDNRPKLNREECLALIAKYEPILGFSFVEWNGPMIVSDRGYFLSMGEPGVNDVGRYDDGSFVISPRKFAAFNGNMDPSRQGYNPNVGKGYAMLEAPQLCWFIFGMHRGNHKALRQATSEQAARYGIPNKGYFTVLRDLKDGRPAKRETGYQAINDHLGGMNGTSSEGCQTTPPAQYWERYNLIEAEAIACGKAKKINGRVEGKVPAFILP